MFRGLSWLPGSGELEWTLEFSECTTESASLNWNEPENKYKYFSKMRHCLVHTGIWGKGPCRCCWWCDRWCDRWCSTSCRSSLGWCITNLATCGVFLGWRKWDCSADWGWSFWSDPGKFARVLEWRRFRGRIREVIGATLAFGSHSEWAQKKRPQGLLLYSSILGIGNGMARAVFAWLFRFFHPPFRVLFLFLMPCFDIFFIRCFNYGSSSSPAIMPCVNW